MMLVLSRRGFLVTLWAAALTGRRPVRRPPKPPGPHPVPRPGVDASKILPASRLRQEHADAIPVFDRAREIPQVLDGIRCQCGCSELPGKYSLLSCFEDDGMAADCETCQRQTRLAHRLHRAGKTLDQIRSAIEEKYG
jgi:hypothetical protein